MALETHLLEHERLIRLVAFIAVFATMALWEIAAPRRALQLPKYPRWSQNLVLTVFNTIIVRLLFPTAALGMAVFADSRGWGVLNIVDLPYWLSVVIAVAALDFAIYLQHVMFHAVPVLWRLHRVHHADLDFDVTTGARFHPIEIVLSMLIKFAVIAVLGPPLLGVLIFEVLLNGTAMFNHSNVKLPLAIDRWLRWFVVTPDMHRVHHSVEADESNCNFGFNMPWWDRLGGTYRDQPRAGHGGMTIGIDTYRKPRDCDRLPGMLLMPFRGEVGDYVINRRWGGSTRSE